MRRARSCSDDGVPVQPAPCWPGGAVGIAVAVASSRVLLDVHWLTDVIGGLALGWAWFTLCGIAFGGRLLRFGVIAEVAGRVAESERSHGASRSRRGRMLRRSEQERRLMASAPRHSEEAPPHAWLHAVTVPAERWFGTPGEPADLPRITSGGFGRIGWERALDPPAGGWAETEPPPRKRQHRSTC